MRATVPLVFLGGALLGSAQVLDFGQMDQYKSKINPPKLSGSTVWLSGKEGDGFDIALSDDAKAKVQGVFEACVQPDNQCYQDALGVLRSADLQIDGQLDGRHFGDLLSKTFKKGAGPASLLADMAAYLMSSWRSMSQGLSELGLFHLSQDNAEKSSVLSEGMPVVISAQGSEVATVTPTPDPTSLQGSQTPSVTPVTEANEGFEIGDLAAVLDEELAHRMDGIIHRELNCGNGQAFDNQNGRAKRRRDGGTLGQVICGAQAVMTNAVRGGTVNDILFVPRREAPLGFANPNGEVARAFNVFSDFVQAYAPMIAIEPELLNQIETYVFALAIDTVMNNLPLTGRNRIAATLITTGSSPTATSTATSSRTGCPDPTQTPLWCGWPEDTPDKCDIKLPDGAETETVCASGEHEGCECNAPPYPHFGVMSKEEVEDMLQVSELFNRLTGGSPEDFPRPTGPLGECKIDDMSNIPSNVFSSDQNKVYTHFCEKWDKGQELTMTVDAAGNNKKPEGQLNKRTPPPNAGTWAQYDFGLKFQPTDRNVDCTKDCNAAFVQLKSSCSNAGGSDSPMAKSGAIDVRCGVFSYSIKSPEEQKTPMKVSERKCHDKQAHHGDVSYDGQWTWAKFFCDGLIKSAVPRMKQGDKPLTWTPDQRDRDALLTYTVSWVDGCTTDVTEQDLGAPVEGVGCAALFRDNYLQCTGNEGAGGSIQAGCLKYDFLGHEGG